MSDGGTPDQHGGTGDEERGEPNFGGGGVLGSHNLWLMACLPDIGGGFITEGLAIQLQRCSKLILVLNFLAFSAFRRLMVERPWEERHESLPVGAGVDEVEVPGLVDGDGGGVGVGGDRREVEEAAVLGEYVLPVGGGPGVFAAEPRQEAGREGEGFEFVEEWFVLHHVSLISLKRK